MKIFPVHRNFIIFNQVIIATVFNFFINLVIAWFLYRNVGQIPLLGLGGIAMDTILTAFMLTLLSYYYIALTVWFTMKMKWLPVIADYPTNGIVSKMIKMPIIVQGIIFGFIALVLIGLLPIAWFLLTRTPSMPYESFRWYKSIFGAALSIIVSPPIGLLSLLNFSRKKEMKNSAGESVPFFRVELNNNKFFFDFNLVHKLRKDILMYFDDNIGEIDDVLMPIDEYKMEYWKYISINYDKEWAESKDYKVLVEEGCLALLFGISCEILYEPVNDIKKEWNGTDIDTILAYLNNYNPSLEKCLKAREYLIELYTYAKHLTWDMVDDEQCLINLNKYKFGKWFSDNIVKEYYKNKIRCNR